MRAMEYTPHPPAPDLSRPPVKDGAFDWDEWRQLRDDDNREFRYRMTKRMSDAECAAEYWRTIRDADVQGYSGRRARPKGQFVIQEAFTWHRFATHPHADEVEA